MFFHLFFSIFPSMWEIILVGCIQFYIQQYFEKAALDGGPILQEVVEIDHVILEARINSVSSIYLSAISLVM